MNSLTLADLTPYEYKAPEVFRGLDPTLKVDMWGLGIILFELTTKRHPLSNLG